MSMDSFEGVHWSTSKDDSLEHGWTEVTSASGGKADDMTIFAKLDRLYWDGVTQEVAAAIAAFVEFEEFQPDALPVETPKPSDFKTDRLENLIDLWNPMQVPDAEAVKTSARSKLFDMFQAEPLERRRARSLLQALGLLDIDFVRESRRPVLRSWGQSPQIEHTIGDVLMRARQCSECRHCIRSFHYYQCVADCEDNVGPRNLYKLLQPGDTERPNLSFELSHMAADQADTSSPFILCPACLHTSSHPREHLRAVRGFSRAGYKDTHQFARELDQWEDDLDGRFLMGLGVNAMDRLAAASKRFSKATSRSFFPAGNSHCAVMFGPLLLENGITRYDSPVFPGDPLTALRQPGGAFLSRRPVPNFTTSSSSDLDDFLADSSDYSMHKGKDTIHQLHVSYSVDKRLFAAQLPLRKRRFASCQKQYSGGLFTSYCNMLRDQEAAVINSFIEWADDWKETKKDKRLSQKKYKAQLRLCAQGVTTLINAFFGEEVNKILLCFTHRLRETAKLQYNRFSNNCQDFSNAMLLNGDKWDDIFEAVYPKVPPNVDDPDQPWSRYLMSFAARMVHPKEEIPFVEPLVSSVKLYDCFGHNDADMIDHVSSIRFKWDLSSQSLSLVGDEACHDQYLLKGDYTTCRGKTCTIYDHLFDGPHDNLSILTMHIHRDRNLYTTGQVYEDFLSTQGPTAWIQNRLEVLQRLFMLNTALAFVSRQFQARPGLGEDWTPMSTVFSRAWHSNKRVAGTTNLKMPSWSDELEKNENYEKMTLFMQLMSTHPFMQEAEAWNTRLLALKKKLKHPYSSKRTVFHGLWSACECKLCAIKAAELNFRRATAYIKSQEHLPPAERRVVTTHPDFVPLKMLRSSVELGGLFGPALVMLKQMMATPECFGTNEIRKFFKELDVDQEHIEFLVLLDSMSIAREEKDRS